MINGMKNMYPQAHQGAACKKHKYKKRGFKKERKNWRYWLMKEKEVLFRMGT